MESSAKGEAKKAYVLLPVGDGGWEDAVEAVVRELRCEERVEELAEGEGLR